MLANLLIVVVLLTYGMLLNLLLKPMPGGDYGVGYSFAYFFYGAGFLISSGLLAWHMNVHQGFDWLSGSFQRYRHWLVCLGWISFVIAVIWSLEYRSKPVETALPGFMGWFTGSKMYIWLPLLVLLPCVYLLKAQRPEGFAPAWVKIPLQAGFSISILIAAVILDMLGKYRVQPRIGLQQAKSAWRSERRSDYQAALDYINNYKEPTIEGLLKYAHPDNDEQRRNAATAKIKSYANWEKDLIDILTKPDLEKTYVYDDNTCYVYAFLERNKVEHPEKFIQPIQYSLKVLKIRVVTSLNDPYNLELGRSDLETTCRGLEAQFKKMAAAFRPDMLQLQQALAITPPERKNREHRKSYDRTLKAYRLAVKDWLASNQ